MARNPKVELRGHEGQVVHPITDGDCVIFPSGETLSHKLSEQEEVMYAPEVTNSSPMFKVGEGDSSDYSANVLDGAYQEAVLKGQTYVNTIQEPSADVITLPTPFTEYERTQSKTFTEMQDGTFGLNLVGQSYVNCIQEPSEPSYVALGENLEFQNKKVEYTSDGQIKSAMLNGMTLVNVGSYYSKSDFYTDNIDTITNDGYIQLTANGTWRNAFTKYNGMLKPSTKYLVIVDIKTNTLADGVQPFRLFTDGDNSNEIGSVALATGQTKYIECGATGVFKYIVTTASDLSNAIVTLRNYISNTVTSGIIVYRTMMIEYQEGMENWDIPYFQGMQSVTMTTELENVCSRYNSSGAKNGKTFTIGTWENRGLTLSTTDNIAKYNFKPNTKYLVQFKVTNLNLDGLSSIGIAFSDGEVSTGNSLFGNNALVEVKSNGIYRGILTTSNVISTSNFVVKGFKNQWEESTSTTRTLTISQIMCIEYQNGMENWDLPYFETTQLMKPLKVQSVNKNIVNLGTFTSQTKNGITLSSLDSSSIKLDGSNTTNDYTNFWLNSLYMKFKTGTYSYNFNYASDYVTYFFKDSNGNNIISTKRQNGTITINNDVEITQVLIQISNGFSIPNQTITLQIEEADTATDYTPHQSKTTSALEPITLRAIGNVKDTLDLSTGEYVQRIGEIVLDGSEDEAWKMSKNSNDTYRFDTTVISGKITWVDNTMVANVLCDKYKTMRFNDAFNNRDTGIAIYNNTHIIINNGGTDLATFKASLSQNPIKVQYELANPTTRKISLEYPNLQTYQDITHVQSIAMDGTLIPNIFLPSDISYKAMLKPNTSYNVIVDREVIDSTNQLTVNLGGTTANITANRTVVTTPSTLSNETLTFSGKDNRLAKAMLIEGSTLINGDLPHFDGIGDVKLGRVVENLCMANEELGGSATVTSTLYTDRIELKVTKAGSCVECFRLTKPLKNDKKYFIYSPSSSSLGNEYVFYGFKQDYNGSLSFAKQVTNFVNGKYSIITPRQEGNEYTHITIGNHGNQSVGTTYSIRRPIICEYIDGMENWDWESIGYFTGTKNISNEFMRIGNKNLFDFNSYKEKIKDIKGITILDNGFKVDSSVNSSIASVIHNYGYIKLNFKEKTKYFINYDVLNEGQLELRLYVRYTDGSKQWADTNTSNHKIGTDSNKTVEYINYTWTTQMGNGKTTLTNVQIEEATSATSYVAHKHNSLHILPDKQIPLTFEQGAIIFSTTTSFAEQINNTMATRIRTGLLDLEPNETYRISFGDKNYICGIAFYDNSNIGLNTVSEISNDYVFTTTKDVHKFCINIAKSDMDANITPSVLHQVRLEKVTDVTLRGFGGVRDELDLTRGVYIQRIKEIILNGKEQWKLCTSAYQPTDTNYINYDLGVDDIKLSAPILCDSIKTRDWNISSVEFNSRSIAGHSTNRILRLCIEKTVAPDVETLKTYLSTNMVKVQYQLRTPIEHKIHIPMKNESNQTIAKPNGIFTLPLMHSETNHVDINSQIYPKVQSRDYISYPVIANNSQLHTVFHNKVGSTDLTVNLCGASTTVNTHKNTITTPSSISQYELRLSGATNKVSNVCVFNGDYMNVNVPYVQGMMNAVNPIVTNTGKNLLKESLGEFGVKVITFEKSLPKSTYIATGTPSKNYNDRVVVRLEGKDSNQNMMRYLGEKIVTYFDVYKMIIYSNGFSYSNSINNLLRIDDFQLEEASTPSQYEPYKENICEPENGQVYLTQDMFEQGSFNELSSEKDYYQTKTASTHALQLKRIRLIDPIPVKPNTKYIVKFNGLEDYHIFVAYFKNNERVGFEGYWKNKEFITPNDCNQIVFVLKRKGDAQILVGDIDYNKLIFSKVDKTITLRSLPNGVRDELNLETGEYIQRIREMTLNDNDYIIDYFLAESTNEYSLFAFVKNDIKNAINEYDKTQALCDKLPYEQIWNNKEKEGFFISNDRHRIFIRISNDKLSGQSVDALNEYLSSNPIKVQYQLETPIIKQVGIHNYPHSYKDGHIIIESNDPSTNVTAQMTYQCVANRTGQIQEHTEQVEKQEHEINELEMLILENIRQQQNR